MIIKYNLSKKIIKYKDFPSSTLYFLSVEQDQHSGRICYSEKQKGRKKEIFSLKKQIPCTT